MGWNKPSGEVSLPPKKPSAMRGVVAGVACVGVAVAVAFFVLSGKDVKPKAEVMKVLRTRPELADDYMKKVNESLAQKASRASSSRSAYVAGLRSKCHKESNRRKTDAALMIALCCLLSGVR